MKMLYPLGSLIAALVLCSLAQSAQAAACGYFNNNRGINPTTGVVPLQISTLSVPRDAPVGTILYQQNFNQSGAGVDFSCSNTGGTAAINTLYGVKGNGANSGFSAGQYAGNLYATGVSGISVGWFNGTSVMTAAGIREAIANGCQMSGSGGTGCTIRGLKFPPTTGMVLVKTGSVGTGTISGSALGRLEQDSSVAGSPTAVTNTLSLSGSINIVALTCQASDVSVPMGTYGTASFTGIGSATGQINFVIRLTGCPGFPGYYGNANSIPTSSQTGVISAGTLVPNTVSLRLDPIDPVIDATNGVLGLTPGAGTATGVGLQVLHLSGAPWMLSQNQLLNTVLGPGTTSLNIPMSARYLQTASTITPGTANAVATYTIIYQ